jgi:hypothetical protein
LLWSQSAPAQRLIESKSVCQRCGESTVMNESALEPVLAFNCSTALGLNVCNGGSCTAATGLCECSITFVRTGDRCQLSAYEVYGAPIYVYRYGYAGKSVDTPDALARLQNLMGRHQLFFGTKCYFAIKNGHNFVYYILTVARDFCFLSPRLLLT